MKGEYDVRILPAPKTLADLFAGASEDDNWEEDAIGGALRPRVTINADSVLRLLPDSARRGIVQQIRMAQLLDKRPVVLMSPFVVTVK